MNNVLLLTDFSDNSKVAINYGVSLFYGLSCCFTLVNVSPESGFSGNLQINSIRNNAPEEAIRQLIDDINSNFPSHKIKFETNILHLCEKISIIDYVKSKQIKFVILGIKSPFEISAFGGSGYYMDLCKKLNCSVLLVPESKKHEKPDKIVLAVDFKNNISGLTLQPLFFFARKLTSEIFLLQISHGKQSIQEAVTGLNVINSFENIPYSFHMVNELGVSRQIALFNKTHDSILMALVANTLNTFKSTTPVDHVSRILFQNKVPLLLIPQ